MCHANRTKIKHHNLLQQCRTIHTSCPPGTRPSSKPFCIQYILSWWAGCPRANDDCASLTWGFDLAHTTPSRSSRSMPTPDSRNAHSTRKLFRYTQKINNFEISKKKKKIFFLLSHLTERCSSRRLRQMLQNFRLKWVGSDQQCGTGFWNYNKNHY